jgi:pimeloyl-ACP methyl ester carboxylesterase
MVSRPPFLYLHGGPGLDHSVFKTGEHNPLSDLAQIIYYDHRGNGRSDRRTPNEWNLDTWADDVVRPCDALGVERPIVFGAAVGGFIAQRYLARHPQHPSKVILACTGLGFDLDATEKAFTRFGGELAGTTARRFFGGDLSVMADFLERCIRLYSTEPPKPEQFTRPVTNLDVMRHFLIGEAKTMDLRAGLTATRCPVLVLGGELDPVFPVEVINELASALPAQLVRLEVIPGVSHLQVAGTAGRLFIQRFLLDELYTV